MRLAALNQKSAGGGRFYRQQGKCTVDTENGVQAAGMKATELTELLQAQQGQAIFHLQRNISLLSLLSENVQAEINFFN